MNVGTRCHRVMTAEAFRSKTASEIVHRAMDVAHCRHCVKTASVIVAFRRLNAANRRALPHVVRLRRAAVTAAVAVLGATTERGRLPRTRRRRSEGTFSPRAADDACHATKKKERAPAASALSSARDCALLSRSRVSPHKHHLAAGSEEGSVQRRRLRRADQHTVMMMVMMVVVTPLSSLLPTGVCTLVPHSPPSEKHMFNRTTILTQWQSP